MCFYLLFVLFLGLNHSQNYEKDEPCCSSHPHPHQQPELLIEGRVDFNDFYGKLGPNQLKPAETCPRSPCLSDLPGPNRVGLSGSGGSGAVVQLLQGLL